MNTAQLRNRIQIQVPIRSRTAQGGTLVEWALLREIYCQVQPLSSLRVTNQGLSAPRGHERNFTGQTRSDVTHKITTRSQPERLTTDMRLVEAIYSQNNPRHRVFNIVEAILLENIRYEMKIDVKENLSKIDDATAAYSVVFDQFGHAVLGSNGEYVVTGAPLTITGTSLPWGEIDFTATANYAFPISAGHYFPSSVVGVVTTLTGSVVTQPTINMGISSNHTKYLSGITFVELNALLKRQELTVLLADQGETSLWIEIATAGSVSSGGTYRGLIYIDGQLIG